VEPDEEVKALRLEFAEAKQAATKQADAARLAKMELEVIRKFSEAEVA
jgi:hypothetical protein